MNIKMINCDEDYLISSFEKTTPSGISELLNRAYSHDQITRLLSKNSFDSSDLWKLVALQVARLLIFYLALVFLDFLDTKPAEYC